MPQSHEDRAASRRKRRAGLLDANQALGGDSTFARHHRRVPLLMILSMHLISSSAILRTVRRAALLCLLLPGALQAQVTIGDQLINRSFDDNAEGGVYLFTGTFGSAGIASSWSFYAGTNAGEVTPLLFHKISPDTFVLTGVGAAVAVPTFSSIYSDRNFSLVAGSDAVDSDYTFGFTDRTLTYPGSGDSLTTTDDHSGVIDYDSSGGSWAFTPSTETGFTIVLGQSYQINASPGGDSSIVSLYTDATRIYSAQLTTSAVPEPATTAAAVGAIAMLAAGGWRLRRRRRVRAGRSSASTSILP
jgi:hypothetical protein